jgi:hypothetical protein
VREAVVRFEPGVQTPGVTKTMMKRQAAPKILATRRAAGSSTPLRCVRNDGFNRFATLPMTIVIMVVGSEYELVLLIANR